MNKRAFAVCGRQLALGSWLELGRSERQSGGEDKDSILADAFEAVLGAIFLDAGLEPVERLVRSLFAEAIERGAVKDAKTTFQEWAHAELRVTPRYETTADSEEEDDDDRFTVEVRIGEEVWGRGVGRSKREAEQRAASEALARLEERREDGDG